MSVRVVCGANSQLVDFAGRTIAEVRNFLAQSLNIPSGAPAYVTGQQAAEDRTLQDGEQVEFVMEARRKG